MLKRMLLTVVLTASPSLATLTFDADLETAGAQAGSGTWSLASGNFWDSVALTDVNWPAVPGAEAAIFGGGVDGTYAITVGQSMTVRSIQFLNSGYTLSAAAPVTLSDFTASGASLSVATGKTATLGANITYDKGGTNLDLTGGGTLVLAGAAVQTGASFQSIRIQSGTTVDVQTGGRLSTNHYDSASINVNNGTLKISGGAVQLRNAHATNSPGAGSGTPDLTLGNGGPSTTGTLTLDSGSLEFYRNKLDGNAIRRTGNLIVGRNNGGAGTGIANFNGGTMRISSYRFEDGLSTPGGVTPSTNGAIVVTAGNSTTGTVHFNGTSATIDAPSVRGLRFFGTDGQTNATATVNLNAGTLTVPVITTYAAQGAGTTGTFNFNGGTLRANATNATYFGATATNLLSVTAVVKAGGAKIDTNGFDVGIGQALLHDATLGNVADGGLTKSGDGVLTVSGASTYTGDTTINAGSVTLANDGSVVLDINDASHSRFLGTGGLTLDGTLRLDVADVTGDNRWTLIAGTLTTSYGDNFAVAFKGAPDTLFTQADNIWSATDGQSRTWTFDESTGVLSIPEPGSLGLIGLAAITLRGRRRARRA